MPLHNAIIYIASWRTQGQNTKHAISVGTEQQNDVIIAHWTRQTFVFQNQKFFFMPHFYSIHRRFLLLKHEDFCLWCKFCNSHKADFYFRKFHLGDWREVLRSLDTSELAHWLFINGRSVFLMFLWCGICTRKILQDSYSLCGKSFPEFSYNVYNFPWLKQWMHVYFSTELFEIIIFFPDFPIKRFMLKCYKERKWHNRRGISFISCLKIELLLNFASILSFIKYKQ